MSEKQDLINRMNELQKKFTEYEQKNGLDPFDFYTPPAGHELAGYKEEYQKLASKVLEMAHAEVGSHA